MTCFLMYFLLLLGLLSCAELDEEQGHIDLGIYYGVPTGFVDQIVETTEEAGEEVRELGESFEPCFGDAIANSTADWIIIVVNSTAKCPSSQPDHVLLLQYDAKKNKIIVPDSSMDLRETIRDFLEIEEESENPSTIFTPSFIALIALCILAIALNACCLLSKRCKRIRMKIRDVVCPCLKSREVSRPKADKPNTRKPMHSDGDIESDTTTSDGEDDETKIDKCFKNLGLPLAKDTWTEGKLITSLLHNFDDNGKRGRCDECDENGATDTCNKCDLKCHKKCMKKISDVPCIPKTIKDVDGYVPFKSPRIFTPLVVLVAALEKRIGDTRHATEDQVVGVYHYDPPNESKLKFHLSDFRRYVRTIRREKCQTPYMAANLKELLRVPTHDKRKYDAVSPLIGEGAYPKLHAVMSKTPKEETEEKWIKKKKAGYIKILTNTELFPPVKRDSLAYIMLHLYRVVNEPVSMDLKKICWELYPSIFGLRKESILEWEISSPDTLKKYRDVFMELLELGEPTWRRFFIYSGQTKCTIIKELADNRLKKK